MSIRSTIYIGKKANGEVKGSSSIGKNTKAHAPTPGCSTEGWAHYEKSRGGFFFVGERDGTRTHDLARSKEGSCTMSGRPSSH